MYSAVIITVSDRCFNKIYEDKSAPVLKELLISSGYEVFDTVIVPDEISSIKKALNDAVSKKISLILTTGGTGFSKRDVTPEATKEVIEREAPGICEAMRAKCFDITNRAILSRAVSGISDDSLIINLPGSPKGAVENLSVVLPSLAHGLQMLLGANASCADLS